MGKPDGGSAFPIPRGSEDGMSLRDYFAGKAIASLLANAELRMAAEIVAGAKRETMRSILSEKAYQYADAMLVAREGGDKVLEAAREMRDALQGLLDVCHDYIPHAGQETAAQYLANAKAAIAKAEAAGVSR